MTEQVLTGLKVLDLTHYIAGPFCSKLLADYGADVIKVERPGTGDEARQAGPFPEDVPDQEKSGLFLYLNANKKGVTLDLKSETGKEIFKKLVKNADVLVENFRPGVMSSLGLGFEALERVNPRLVMTSISNFGQTGPYRDWKGAELTIFALCGQMYRMGDPRREPLKLALSVFQYFAGEVASFTSVAAAMRGAATGKGEYIDISILEPMVADANNRILMYTYCGDKGTRKVAANYPSYPFGCFKAKDGYVAIQGLGGGEDWIQRLYTMIGRPELKDDPRFATPDARAKHNDEFYGILNSWLEQHAKQEIFDDAARVRYPVAAVYSTAELVRHPHYHERGFFVEIEHPRAGKLTYPGAQMKTSEAGYAIRMPAPLLGQHNKEIFCDLLGYAEKDLGVLRMRGVI